MRSSDCWRCLGAQVTWGLFCPQTSSFAHQQHLALWYYPLPSPFVCADPTSETLLLHWDLAAWSASTHLSHGILQPLHGMLHPSSPRCSHLGVTPGPWHPSLSGSSFQGEVTELTSFSLGLFVLCLLWIIPIIFPPRCFGNSAFFPQLIRVKVGKKTNWDCACEKVALIFSILLSSLWLRRDRAVAGCMQI